MRELQQQVHVDINYSQAVDVHIGLENIMSGVGENMAYRLAKMIREQGLEGTPLKMFATLSFEKVTPADRWVRGEGEYHWDRRPSMVAAGRWDVDQHCPTVRAVRDLSGLRKFYIMQDGLCAFCEQPLADDNTTHLDHNHETGEVRGLVHAGCNVMIGGIENAIALVGMERLMRYVGW